MKLLVFLAALFGFSAGTMAAPKIDYAFTARAVEFGRQVARGPGFHCTATSNPWDGSDVYGRKMGCWDDYNMTWTDSSSFPDFSDPVQMDIANYHVFCALDGKGLQCFDPFAEKSLPLPIQLKNPTEFKLVKRAAASAEDREFSGCAIDEEGVKCWGGTSGKDWSPPGGLRGSSQIGVAGNLGVEYGENFRYGCALNSGTVVCWRDTLDKGVIIDEKIPPMKNPRQVEVGAWRTCVLDDSGMKCWWNEDSSKFEVGFALKNPRYISLGFGRPNPTYDYDDETLCALEEVGVRCWGGELREEDLMESPWPEFKNPVAVIAGYQNACVLDDEGMKCWEGWRALPGGETQPTEVSGYAPESYELLHFVSRAVKHSSPGRAAFFSGFQPFLRENLLCRKNCGEHLNARYLQLSFLGPAFLSGESEFFAEQLIPEYKKMLGRYKKKARRADIKHVPDSILNRKVALQTLRSVLTVMLEFVSVADKGRVGESLRLVGIATQDPSDKNVKSLLDSLDGLEKIKQELSASRHSAFLVETLDLVTKWWKGKL